MPELPEVEVVRRGLLNKILGETIERVEIFREQSIAYPAPEQFSRALRGLTFVDVSRRGKYLLLHLHKKEGVKLKLKQNSKSPRDNKTIANVDEGAILVIHLRMSGRLLLADKETAGAQNTKFLRARISFISGKTLSFNDMRVFGRLWYISKSFLLPTIIPSFTKLGLEPLDVLSENQLLQLFKGRRQALKSVLLDQTLLAGIGNIYADEILFQAGIHPLMPAAEVNGRQAKILARVIPLTLNKAIASGGSSIKDFAHLDGVNGNYQHQSLVYGRSGKACRICQTKIERLKIAGRSAHFCPFCQQEK